MDETLFELLKTVDTPTVCNAIEVVEGKRGFDNFTRKTLVASDPAAPAIVGYALTAKIAALEPPSRPAQEVRDMRMAYYRYMSDGPKPSVAVIEDLDGDKAIGAFWGEINTSVHKGFGLGGVVTNGLVRDLGDLPPGFPVLAGGIGPSHAFVHVRDIDCPVRVFGLQVRPGDLIHADRHGALAIPAEVVPGLADGIAKLLETEKIVLAAARQDGFNFEKFEAAWAAFEKART